jgi:S1-C subfamily serine protease
MKKTIAALMTTLLFLPACAFNVNTPHIRSLSNRLEDSTVMLRMKIHMTTTDKKTGEKKERSGWGTCSGVYIKKNIILSAAHCVDMDEKGMELKGVWIQAGNQSAKAVVVKMDPAADLALLYTSLSGTPINFAHRVVRGQDCWVVGNPLGLQDILTRGIVSKIHFVMEDEKASFIIIDAVALPGNSGGPVVDSQGRLIGILTRSTSLLGELGAAGLGIAVDLKTIVNFLKA